MNKYIIIHGHFYQPPREDPWTGLIERQESAAPFMDWNRRITAESYAACGASRVLDANGSILSIINNYSYLSFNFGPTLLTWLEKEAPNVYQRILEADKESLKRLGHGNAVAQSFNHTILPLDAPESAKLQIEWGLADFQGRFGREAEGMWLPECAVNESVLDILIEKGLKYVILSPWQGESIIQTNGRKKSLGVHPAPSDRPFRVNRPKGSIAAFFYEGDLASRISFGHLLRSREGLEEALRSAFSTDKTKLVSVATDGEIYGHHEPYGDMCLSALIDHLGDESDLKFTNYAAYLEENPPKEEVILRPGDEGRGTSWSCSHGVGRWMRDCGCSTGGEEGWNQKWRKPLRIAFDSLKKEADPIWKKMVSNLTDKPVDAVFSEYGRVVSGLQTSSEFVGTILDDEHNDTDAVNLLIAMEGAKFLQFMYTSCGWFFADISGIEPIQNMRYAYRAAELLDPNSTKGLVDRLTRRLERVESNIQIMGNGSDLLRGLVTPKIQPELKAAALFFWRHLYNLPGLDYADWGYLQGKGTTRRTVDTDEGELRLEGEISYEESSTLRSYTFPYRTVIDEHLFCPVVELMDGNQWTSVPIKSMPTVLRMEIQKTLLKRSEKRLMVSLGSKVADRLMDLKVVKALDLPFGATGWQSLELALHYGPMLILKRMRKMKPRDWSDSLELMDQILGRRVEFGVDLDAGNIEQSAGLIISEVSEYLEKHSDKEMLGKLIEFLGILQQHGLRPLRPFVQNAVYALLEQRFNRIEEDDTEKDSPCRSDILDLAYLLNINPERFVTGCE
jgi:hypothetical protein